MLPIVLHHGIFGFGNFRIGKLKLSYFAGGIERALAERGHPLIVSRVHPTAGIATRARQLKETILRQLDILGRPNDPVIVFGHSMGGLDARYMIRCLGMEDRVRALVTISTPHRGSSYADWCLRNLGYRLGGLRLMRLIGFDVQAVSDLTLESCRRFNERVPDSPAVRYYSVSASRPWNRVPAFALHAYKVIHDVEGENDCLVSVKSAIWGKHLGTWPADHFHQINKRLVLELIEPTGNITPYYLKLLDALKEDGVE
jgi:triacylglycerol lipase